MPEFKITWDIELNADSPEEAAEEALEIMRDIHNEALAFEVVEQGTDEYHYIDLLPF